MAFTLHEPKPSLIVYMHTSPLLLPANASIRISVLWQLEQSRSLIYPCFIQFSCRLFFRPIRISYSLESYNKDVYRIMRSTMYNTLHVCVHEALI